jgi:galactokinase/mevalonate kinase-like predicted kinase
MCGQHADECFALFSLGYGATLAGAGGGGFLVLFAPPSSHSAISKILSEFNAENKQTECRMYAATVCAEEGSCRRMAVRKA